MKRSLFIICALALIFSSFTTQQPVTWVALGDSITYLNDHLNETGNRDTKGYMTRVTEKLPHITYVNQGHNGWTAVGIAQNIEKLSLTRADVYTVFLGTNDWWGGVHLGTLKDYTDNTGTGTTYGAFRIIIDKLRSLNSNAKIILITPMQRSDFVYIADKRNNAFGSYKEKNGQSLAQFVDAVNNIGRLEHFEVADLYNKSGMTVKNAVKFKRLKDAATGEYRNYKYPDYIGIPFNPATDEYPYPTEAVNFTYDGLHPSDKGYQVIANMLLKMFKGSGI
ncbi:SGNH/GDSL hydrolase family protein [Mucilaginibacter sp. UR6-11]|uniref:SGNH/GDSL hydrolase family protein n=1 Tax=Mucilaginibacter sp. UR6-11 TaxID=1435644 RepID=UPI001E451747|nr:SGNH/GDSL hydrolase family protein [Mucilaginibacter sp. UR6-11]MCC8426936.1 SGNH/GDSL hydrolase family protein [Mucilaginibacter sp. UR6-11]